MPEITTLPVGVDAGRVWVAVTSGSFFSNDGNKLFACSSDDSASYVRGPRKRDVCKPSHESFYESRGKNVAHRADKHACEHIVRRSDERYMASGPGRHPCQAMGVEQLEMSRCLPSSPLVP